MHTAGAFWCCYWNWASFEGRDKVAVVIASAAVTWCAASTLTQPRFILCT